MYCTDDIKGKVTRAIHKVANPNEAPAMAYVPIPEGSSSEAPVIKPGPRIFKKRRKILGALGASREAGPPAGGTLGMRFGEDRYLVDTLSAREGHGSMLGRTFRFSHLL